MFFVRRLIRQFLKHQAGIHTPDFFFLGVAGAILFFGLIMLSSASSAYGYTHFGDSYYYLKHQLVSIVIGLGAWFFFARIDYHNWKRYAVLFLFSSFFLLILVFIPGLSAHYGKARSWINIFGYSLQPSELVKLSFLVYLAAWLERRGQQLVKSRQGLISFISVFSFIAFLMILQPDLGTLLIIGAVSLIIYFVAGGRVRHIAGIITVGLVGIFILLNLNTYQMDRIKCVLDADYSPSDKCYQINQSLLAVGSGGLWGRGLGASRQKYMYLPEVYGDAIFAIIGEEMGFFFSVGLVLAYFYLFYRGLRIARSAPDKFGLYLGTGISAWIFLQAALNIGGMINLIPMTGVPLPLVSYGGTAILAVMSGLGIMTNISRQTRLGR
ncbi:putative lipid II flippase FtsW [Candidatus Falkowbacteria bacterium CG_4_10_14_0_2_um_filter_48_10]|nr:MAG: putative lipid II flippase FtsW [Candidatus Falkowbacteria bacterium CG_4_10_14_0_2_um_filter_48_10]